MGGIKYLTHAEHEALRAEVEKLRAAIKPFASEAGRYGESFADDFRPDVKMHYTVVDLRRARDAYQSASQRPTIPRNKAPYASDWLGGRGE